MPNKTVTVGVVGLWHLGSVYSAGLIGMGYSVVAFDANKKVINNFKKGIPPIFEPGLTDALEKYSDRISFSSAPSSLKNKDYIFITHDLEVDEHDVADVSVISSLFALVAKQVNELTTIVISSQIPVSTSRGLVSLLLKRGFKNPKVIYFPENLRLGTAFDSFLKPDRIILGSDNIEAIEQFKKDFIFPCPYIAMGLESAEMVKHALNAYLATCISLSCELSDIAEKTGADMFDVVKALHSDKRVSPYAPLLPGLGFAGGTLGRDIQSLSRIAKKYSYTPRLIQSVYSVNLERVPGLVKKIQQELLVIKRKKIGILGLTYKPNTSTLRRSMSLDLASLLHKKGAKIIAFDPAVKETVDGYPYMRVATSVVDFASNLDIIVLMTDWKEFLEVDPSDLVKVMNCSVIIDTKNFLNKEQYKKSGFIYKGIGTKS